AVPRGSRRRCRPRSRGARGATDGGSPQSLLRSRWNSWGLIRERKTVGRSGPLLGALALALRLALRRHALVRGRGLLDHGACDRVAGSRQLALAALAVFLRLERGGAGRRVAADHVELLAHRPQVGDGPVDEDTDREGH